MLRRALILFGNELNTENLLETGKALKERYGCEIKGLYVKDVRKHEIIPPSVEGLIVDPSSRYLVEEWERFEKEHIEALKNKVENFLEEEDFIIREGVTPDTALNELKGYDMLIVGKGNRVSSDLRSLLKNHYKPLMIISEKPLKFGKVMIANDKSFKINKSFFYFISIFEDLKDFDSCSVELSEEKDNSLEEYLEKSEKNLRVMEHAGDKFEILFNESENYDVIVMGDLSHSFMVEKITGGVGLKLVERLKTPIFIS